MVLLLELFFTGFIGFLFMLTCCTCSQPLFQSTQIGKVMFGIALLSLIVIEGDMIRSTSRAEEALEPLMTQFYRSSMSEPDHRYASDVRGSTLDYGGSLDSIIHRRNKLTQEIGLSGMLVEWHTDGGSASCQGLYYHWYVFLIGFTIWILLIAVLSLSEKPVPKYPYRR
jgi:hypothetical protein